MSATQTKNVKSRRLIALVAIFLLIAAIAAGMWYFTSSPKGTPAAEEPHSAVMDELQMRGFSYMTYEGVAETGAEMFYADLGNCRVRVQYHDGIYAVMVGDHRVVDPTATLLLEDPVLGKCLQKGTEAPPPGN